MAKERTSGVLAAVAGQREALKEGTKRIREEEARLFALKKDVNEAWLAYTRLSQQPEAFKGGTRAFAARAVAVARANQAEKDLNRARVLFKVHHADWSKEQFRLEQQIVRAERGVVAVIAKGRKGPISSVARKAALIRPGGALGLEIRRGKLEAQRIRQEGLRVQAESKKLAQEAKTQRLEAKLKRQEILSRSERKAVAIEGKLREIRARKGLRLALEAERKEVEVKAHERGLARAQRGEARAKRWREVRGRWRQRRKRRKRKKRGA